MNCNNQCNRLCPNYIISNSLTIVTIGGVDTLVVDIPDGAYFNKEIYCLVIAQNRPATATVDMPVSISIGGDTATVYPLVCNATCLQANACQISGRTKIKTIVQTNTTAGVFRALSGLGYCCYNRLRSIPAPATTAPAVAEVATFARVDEIPVGTTTTKQTTTLTTTTKKEISE